jgi:hypothetical protein
MFAVRNRTLFASLVGVTSALGLAAASVHAQSPNLYYEDFTDDVININGTVNNGVIADGIASLDDATATGRASFVVRQDFIAEIMTFQVDLVAPIVPTGTSDPQERMELILRAGVGTANNTMSNAEHVVEAIAFRTTSRIPLNNGKESLFLVFNNKATELTFPSPVDALDVVLPAYNYVPYVFDRENMTWTQLKAPGHSNLATEEPARAITRVGIGSSSNGDIGTFAIDNVFIRSGVFFDRTFPAVEPPALVGDFDDDEDVDADDLTLWKTSYATNAIGDADNDGDSDGEDFLLWQRNVTPAAPVGAVPEPTALALSAFALVAALNGARRRQRRS